MCLACNCTEIYLYIRSLYQVSKLNVLNLVPHRFTTLYNSGTDFCQTPSSIKVWVSNMEKLYSCCQWTAEDTQETYAHKYIEEAKDALPVWLQCPKSQHPPNRLEMTQHEFRVIQCCQQPKGLERCRRILRRNDVQICPLPLQKKKVRI